MVLYQVGPWRPKPLEPKVVVDLPGQIGVVSEGGEGGRTRFTRSHRVVKHIFATAWPMNA